MNIFIFVGAGASAELGVPTMRPMAEEFLLHLKDLSWPSEDYRLVEQTLEDNNHDMEHLVERIDRLRQGQEEQKSIGMAFDEVFLNKLQSIAREAEWFVQYACEKIQRIRAEAVWKPPLMEVGDHVITISTSNYDRGIEIGARAAGIALDDGFNTRPHVEVAAWRNFCVNAQVSLLKVHGSTDWYLTPNGAPVKLRHPIPLLGDFELCEPLGDTGPLSTALILPSREKRITTPPYPSINATFHTRARTADAAVFLGTSLRDPHLRSVFYECVQRIPTALVGRNVSLPSPHSAILIRQSASFFLASTFPRLLNTGPLFVDALCAETDRPCKDSVIDALILAHDSKSQEAKRCAAIETLLRVKFCMRGPELKLLLSDVAPGVRRFAVGLIPTSIQGDGLVDFATQIAIERADSEMQEEVRLLSMI